MHFCRLHKECGTEVYKAGLHLPVPACHHPFAVPLGCIVDGKRQHVPVLPAVLLVWLTCRVLLLQLELGNMYQQGDLTRLWSVASQTDLTFNLVS